MQSMRRLTSFPVISAILLAKALITWAMLNEASADDALKAIVIMSISWMGFFFALSGLRQRLGRGTGTSQEAEAEDPAEPSA